MARLSTLICYLVKIYGKNENNMSTDLLGRPEYTANDIGLCSVYVRLKDGTPLVANVKNPMMREIIVGLCQFVKIPPDQVSVTTIQELICQSE